MRWTAVVLAGSRPGADPFALAHGTDLKALIPVAGVPMVRRPVAALLACEGIAAVRVLTQSPERIAEVLPADDRLSVEASKGSIAETLEGLCFDSSIEWPLLVTTADHALLSPAIIADFCARAGAAEIAIGVVERLDLLERFPQSKRTWIPFRGGAYTGANLFALGSPKVLSALELWRSVEQDRKKAWRLLAAFGPWLLLGSLLRLATIEQALARLGRRLGLRIRPVMLDHPFAAIDVDKPEDLALVESILAEKA